MVIVLLFGVAWFLHGGNTNHAATMFPFVQELLAVVMALVTGRRGGELVERLRVGVGDDANLDAPSSLGGPVTSTPVPQQSRPRI